MVPTSYIQLNNQFTKEVNDMAERTMTPKRTSTPAKRESEGRFASTNRAADSRQSKSRTSKQLKNDENMVEHNEIEEE